MKEQTKIPSPEIPGIRNTEESQGKRLRLSYFLWEKVDTTMQTMYPDFSTLTTKELLAITLRESCTSEAVDELSQHFTLRELTEATVSEVSALKGMGKKKTAMLLASIELAKRLSIPASDVKIIHSPQDVASLLMNEMRYLDREVFRVLLLNTKNVVLKNCLVSVGSVNSSLVHPREIFKPAIKNSASAIILIHNHPSGCCPPSNEDIEITKKLVEAGKIIGISILDHIIIGHDEFYSFKDKGLL